MPIVVETEQLWVRQNWVFEIKSRRFLRVEATVLDDALQKSHRYINALPCGGTIEWE